MRQKRKEDWAKRGRNEHLTEADVATLRSRLRDKVSSFDAARELRCSVRVVQKYYSQFSGRQFVRAERPSRAGLDRKPSPQRTPVDRQSRFYKSTFEL